MSDNSREIPRKPNCSRQERYKSGARKEKWDERPLAETPKFDITIDCSRSSEIGSDVRIDPIRDVGSFLAGERERERSVSLACVNASFKPFHVKGISRCLRWNTGNDGLRFSTFACWLIYGSDRVAFNLHVRCAATRFGKIFDRGKVSCTRSFAFRRRTLSADFSLFDLSGEIGEPKDKE